MIDSQLISPLWIERLITLGRAAGEAIMDIYQARDSYSVSHKSDDSPLTAADLAAHQLIAQQLPGLLDVPVMSEESPLPPFSERQNWKAYWLVDPLDGTKEFVAGTGEFTVNIALISAGRPVIGLVHVPVEAVTYLGISMAADPAQVGAWKYQPGQPTQSIHVSSLQDRYRQGLPLRILLSHRHGAAEAHQLVSGIERYWPGGIEACQAGSSLKFCRIAEGKADFYPRLAPTSEWDTAAAQAVLESAGGSVVNATDNLLKPLQYNTQQSVINPSFYALGDEDFAWCNLLQMNSL